jgi:spermidine synthase
MINYRRLIIWSIIGTGISSIAVQLVTIREFLSQFHGNEITIALVLSSWLLVTGLGSLVAKYFKRSSLTLYSLLIVFIAIWPLIQIISVRGFRELIFIHGASPGFYQIFFYIMITTAPYCLLVGFILPYALKVMHACHYEFTSGELYITDSIGDITGGILFSFILVYWMKPFKTIALTSSLLIAVAMLLLLTSRKYLLLVATILSALLFYLFSLNGQFEISTLARQYGEIVRYLESPYGRIVVTKEGPQHTFWESGLPLYSDANIMNSEEKVHYPLSQLERLENVLLVSGGLGETLEEVSKYHPKHIDYVELDPYLTDTAQELGLIQERPSLTIKNTDGRSHIKKADRVYDAIIIDLPDPDTFQINRFFTSEFFSLAKTALSQGGILSFGLKYSPNYISEIRKKKLSTIFSTARRHFQNVMVLPGGEAYFLCSDGVLSADIPANLRMKSVETTYISGFYHGNVTPERIKQLQDTIEEHEYINTDFEPRVMNIIFQEWFKKHGTSPKPFFLVLLGFTGIYLIFMRKEEYLLFSTGLATMGVEMLIVFTFQVIYGYIYLKIGAIITVFLLGLLPGAIVGNLYREKKVMSIVVSESVLMCQLLIFFVWINLFKGELHQFYFLGYCFVFSFFCGFQFPVATEIIGERKSPVAGCLAADLTGAAVGTIFTGALLIPLWGIQSAIIFLILVKISSAMLFIFSKLKESSQ